MLAGCYGRIQDGDRGRKIDPKPYGIDTSKPALLVFGAVWCKPCLSEIGYLNRAKRDLGDRVQILSFVVEGPQKGVQASPRDADLLISPKGDRPEYRVALDESWSLFDAIKPADGRALPTMVFVDSSQTIQRIVQKSMEYEFELLPSLQALIAGQTVEDPKPEPEPPPEQQDPGRRETLTFARWSAMPGNEPSGQMYLNVEAAWRRGLGDYAFTEMDMPFTRAKITAMIFQDGHSYPAVSVWNAAETGCRLTVFHNEDGSYNRSEGICR